MGNMGNIITANHAGRTERKVWILTTRRQADRILNKIVQRRRSGNHEELSGGLEK